MKKITASIITIVAFLALAGAAHAGPSSQNVPDAGTTSSLMGIAVAGLVVVRRFFR